MTTLYLIVFYDHRALTRLANEPIRVIKSACIFATHTQIDVFGCKKCLVIAFNYTLLFRRSRLEK